VGRKWSDIFDFYADHLRATPAPLKRLIRAVDLKAIGWADALILADDARLQQVRGSRPKRVEIVYNTPQDVSRSPLSIQPQEAEPAGKGLGLA
jgi:hypothetical protein